MDRLKMDISGLIPRRLPVAMFAVAALVTAGLVTAPVALAQDGPTIDVWYGLEQNFGIPGEPQIFCDIPGNVSDPDGMASLSYTLNGGAPVDMTIGVDGRRLVNPGDFIVDLLVADLQVGANTVVLTAIDNNSDSNVETVTLNYSAGNSWPTTYDTDWGNLLVDGDPLTPDPAILEQAHVVDGKWTVIGDSIRTIEPGYDRLIGLGELGWGDYEVTVPITIHEILNTSEFGVGIIFRWNGHTNDPPYCEQPLCGWKPLGDIGWIKNNGLNLWGNLTGPWDYGFNMQLDTLYQMKMRVETGPTGAVYSLKVWEDSQTEPSTWNLTRTQSDNSPMAGSVLLVAHEADASFGNVSIVPITSPNDPPVANDVAANAKFDGTSFIDILFNDTDADGMINPASVSIVSPPSNGTITSIDPVTGIVEYLHGGNANPNDTFTYTVEDNDGALSNIATVTLTIQANQPPVANDVAANAKFDATSFIDILFNDTDADGIIMPATVSIVNPPSNGTITNINPLTGVVEYLHGGNANPTDTFTYTVEDDNGALSNIATVTLTILPNQPPVANDDAAAVNAGDSVLIDVPDNDIDSDGALDLSTVTIVDSPLHGTISDINPTTGVVNYSNFGGVAVADSFTYTIADDDAAVSNIASVVVTITPNLPPVANDDNAYVAFNTSGMIDVLANDTDGDGSIDPTTVNIIDPASYGITSVDPATGVVTYTHNGIDAGPDSFTYTVEDDSGDLSNIATVYVTIGQIPPEDFYSDDFNSCGVDPMWHFINPQGDSPDPVIVGEFTGDAQIAISVPGGSNHEPYDGVLNAPYIIQAAPDKDFTLDVKFSSTLPDTAFAEQGILVLQDNMKWLRFDFHSNDTAIRVFATSDQNSPSIFVGDAGTPGDAPLYLRVQRTGDNWDLYYSADGSSWTLAGNLNYALTVTSVGLFAGNSGDSSAPAFTTFVDYFSNSVDPIVEPDDQDLTNSLFVTVSGNGSVGKSPDQAVYACGDPVQLTATADADWVFTGWSGDLTGTENPTTITMDRPHYVTAVFAPVSGAVVAANTSGVPGISTGNPCAADIPVEILRDVGDNIRGFTVTFALTNLDLCDGTASILEGDFLSSIGGTTMQVTDNLDDSYIVDVTINGEPCGATALLGTLFTLDVTNTIPSGTGTIEVTDVQLRDCSNGPLPVMAGAPANILIDTTAPGGVTNLAFNKVLTGNPAGNVTAVDLSWTASEDPDVVSVLVFRKGFGFYPEYSDGGGSAPTLPTDPVAEGWEIVASVPVGSNVTTDLTPTRDYWYFCAQAVNSVGSPSPAVMTGGVLNYLLADVSDGGAPPTDGDNLVWTEDITLLGAHYGTMDGDGLYLNTLDIGPSSDASVDGLPTTDNLIEFEDLMLFGINYGTDASASSQILAFPNVPDPAVDNTMALHLPDLPEIGQTFTVNLAMSGDGQIQGLTIPLIWDAGVVEPIMVQGGPLLTEQGGNSLTLSAEPGVVDVCLAGIRESGISGVGTVATVTFKLLAAGDPQLQLLEIDARDQANKSVPVTTTAATPVDGGGELPVVSTLYPNYPNPFNPMTTIAFDLAVAGRVRIDIFSVDGRRIRSLVDGTFTAGRHSEVWNGKDQTGRTVASGTYLYVMEGPRIKQTRRMLLIK